MNKQELVEAVLANQDAKFESKAAADRAVKAVLDALAEGIKAGGVQIIGFGNFNVKDRPARQGINPLTGEKIRIAASKAISFKASAPLKAKVNEKKAAKKAAAKAPAKASKAPAKAPAKKAAKKK